MRTVLLLLLPLVFIIGVTYGQGYEDLTKAKDVEPLEYASGAASNIRSITQSYMYNLMKKQSLTEYIDNVEKMFKDASTVDGLQEYAKTYTVHVAMVGLGIVLFFLLLISFFITLATCCCVCCCNTQKYSSSMAMWRMIWGGAVVLFLAVNIAGLAIAFVSGSQILNFKNATDTTIDKVGDDMVDYLATVDTQLEDLRSDQFSTYLDKVKPLINDTAEKVVTEIKATTTPNNYNAIVGDINTTLTAMDGVIVKAEGYLDSIDNELGLLITNLTDVGNTFTTCANAFTACGTYCPNPYNFQSSLDINKVKSAQTTVTDLKAKLDKAKTVDGKDLAAWATYVTDKWDNIDDDIKEQIAPTDEEFQKTITEAKKTFDDNIKDNVQTKLKDLQNDIKTNKDDIKSDVDVNLQYLKDLALRKTPDPTGVSEVLAENEQMLGYAAFGVLVLTSVIVAFLVLIVILGLAASILGCCKADDDLLPNERKTEPCRIILCGTSVCSVILCAFASLVAGILLTVVLAEEGMCKANHENKLVPSMDDLLTKYAKINVSEEIKKTLEIDTTLTLTDAWTGCGDSKTVGAIIGLDKDTEIFGFSFSSIQDEIDEAIDNFDIQATVDGLAFDYRIIDEGVKTSLEDAKSSVDSFDPSDIKNSQLAGDAGFTDATVDDIIADIDTANNKPSVPDPVKTKLKNCKSGLMDLKNDNVFATVGNPITTKTASIGDSLQAFEGNNIKTDVATNVDKLVNDLTKLQDGLFGNTIEEGFVKTTLKKEIDTKLKTVTDDTTEFIDWLVVQFQTTILNCQPIVSTIQTLLNFTCDSVLIHLTLLYSSLSLIGISLLFYMCTARALSRYFRRYSRLYPGDESLRGNGWGKNMIALNNKVGPADKNYYLSTQM